MLGHWRVYTSVRIALLIVPALYTQIAVALENTKVLPKGVRNVNIKSVETSIDSKTDAYGIARPLGNPLEQDLTFTKIIKGRTPEEGLELSAFLLAHGLDESQIVGSYTADLKGQMRVIAPVISYGLSDKWTLAVAIPYYQAKTAISMGFRQTPTAATFVGYLSDPSNNQTKMAREAGNQFNNAVTALNTKLADEGYRQLTEWEGAALGDVTLAAKNRFLQSGNWSAATTTGIVLPTGRIDNPDVLNDIGFGDGQWDLFSQIAFDQKLSKRIFVNQYMKYTWQAPGKKPMRLMTEDESISVPKENVAFDLGDRFDAGVSLNYESPWGLVSGAGFSFQEKSKDHYQTSDGNHLIALEAASVQRSQNGEFSLGYSTIEAYQRGQAMAPFEVRLNYVRQFASSNLPITHLAIVDANLFF